MTGLCGWLDAAATSDTAAALLTAMAARLSGSGSEQRAITALTACAVRGGELYASEGLITAVYGEPRWSEPALHQLATSRGHAVALAEAYRRHDADLLGILHGAFTVAVLDASQQRLLLAIDRIGQHSLYYAPVTAGLGFGSSAGCLCQHPAVDNSLSAQGIYNYLYFHMLPSPGSIYAAQRKLPGGHYLDWQQGRLQVAAYWQPAFTETSPTDSTALGQELQALIEQAVQRSTVAHTGAFLSGGLDSSTVAGMLARTQAGPARTYSIGFHAEGYDELPYARLAARHFGTQSREYYVTPEDTLTLIPEIARAYDEPFGNSSALPVYCCARLARQDGIGRLLAGDGGDELFGGNERYAKQQLFEHYHKTPALLRRQVLEPLLERSRRLPGAGKAYSYVRQANIPLPDRLETYNFLHRHDPAAIFTADFLSTVDTTAPLSLLRNHYAAPAQASVLNRMLYLDWQRTLHDNDLVKVNRMCQLAGVDVAYPLLDDELVAFSCTLPSDYKIRRGQLRWFYKQALRDFLPEGTIRKTKHGFGLPFGVWTRTHPVLRTLAYDSLHSLRGRGWFRHDFLERVADLHGAVHAAYYGELVWLLMMLAQWLDSHDSAA